MRNKGGEFLTSVAGPDKASDSASRTKLSARKVVKHEINIYDLVARGTRRPVRRGRLRLAHAPPEEPYHSDGTHPRHVRDGGALMSTEEIDPLWTLLSPAVRR